MGFSALDNAKLIEFVRAHARADRQVPAYCDVGFLLRVTDVERQPFRSGGLRLRHHRERVVRAGVAVGVGVGATSSGVCVG